MHKDLHVFLWLVLRKPYAHCHMDILTCHRGKILFLEFCSDSFRGNGAVSACCHGQEDRKFFAAITIGGICLAQASFYQLTESQYDLVSLDMAVSVVELLEIVKIEKEKRHGLLPIAVYAIDLHF